MDTPEPAPCTAFDGPRLLASGALPDVARAVKEHVDRDPRAAVLIFDDRTGGRIEVDLRGGVDAVVARLSPPSAPDTETRRGPGRPKLGVVAREVTLLPRHWEWLGEQPGGASVALRKLVDAARRENAPRDRVRRSQEAAYRFLSAVAGNYAGFEEVSRALFAGDAGRFAERIASWPVDVAAHARRLAADAFAADAEEGGR